MIKDFDIIRQMYATLCGAIDDALTLLEQGNIWDAQKVLQRSLDITEKMYVDAEQAVDELAELRDI